jgi:mannose-6-phosphate isomerase-like protein (cupin superfamily)
MANNFPEPILKLPEADIPLKGITAYLSQGENNQIIFMYFNEDVELPEHSHKAQWGTVFEGKLELTIGGIKKTYTRGDTYYIPDGVKHSGFIYGGLNVMDYFDQKDRYAQKRNSK